MAEAVTIGERPVETVGEGRAVEAVEIESRSAETVPAAERAIEQLRVDPDVVYKSGDGLGDGGLGASLFGH